MGTGRIRWGWDGDWDDSTGTGAERGEAYGNGVGMGTKNFTVSLSRSSLRRVVVRVDLRTMAHGTRHFGLERTSARGGGKMRTKADNGRWVQK